MYLESVFPPMVRVIKPKKIGRVILDHVTVSEADSRLSAVLAHSGLDWCPAGTYARLLIDSGVRQHIMMSDTRMERLTNIEVVRQARGHVLIAGLGLGMILIPILKKKEVKRVTVVEIDKDVIKAVEPQIRRYLSTRANMKLNVVHANIDTWRPGTPGRQFDTIYFDIWHEVSTDHLDEMRALRKTFRPYLRVGGWSGCWKLDILRDEKRRDG